jgi:glycine betaine/proline transport system substrate-binding protein
VKTTTAPWRRRTAGAAVVSAAALLAASCAAEVDDGAAGDGGGSDTVRMAINGWVGYEASAAVLTHLLEHELDQQVEWTRIDEQPAWQGLDDGDLDVIVENWGHEDLMERYGPEGNGTVVDGGPNGNEGIITWYMPAYLVEEYPGINTLEGLAEHTEVFTTPETGDQGEFLAGDPSFVTNDQGMINGFDLDFEIVHAGSEAAQITEIRERFDNEEPALFYFWEPHWLHQQLDMVRVELPPYEEGCDADEDEITCDYPEYDLNKIFRADFVEEGGPAYELLDNWTWTNEQQDEVSMLIEDEGMESDEAAAIWVEDNEDVWHDWLP